MRREEWNELETLLDDGFVKFLLGSLRDLEGERAASIDETVKAQGGIREELRERFCSLYGQHEAMDRSFIAMEHVDSYLVNHPYVQFSPEAYRLAQLASMCLAQLYQECGKAELESTGIAKCSKCSQPSASGRGFLSSLRSWCSSFWLKMIGPVELESL